jgi:hypothetical protein
MSTKDMLSVAASEIARCVDSGCAMDVICGITGLAPDEVELIKASAHYKQACDERKAKQAKDRMKVAELKRDITMRALSNTASVLATAADDGEYALRALSVMHRVGGGLVGDEKPTGRDIAAPDGAVTLSIPAHALSNINGVTMVRIETQAAYREAGGKDVGMIGAEQLKQFMGGFEDRLIESKATEEEITGGNARPMETVSLGALDFDL